MAIKTSKEGKLFKSDMTRRIYKVTKWKERKQGIEAIDKEITNDYCFFGPESAEDTCKLCGCPMCGNHARDLTNGDMVCFECAEKLPGETD